MDCAVAVCCLEGKSSRRVCCVGQQSRRNLDAVFTPFSTSAGLQCCTRQSQHRRHLPVKSFPTICLVMHGNDTGCWAYSRIGTSLCFHDTSVLDSTLSARWSAVFLLLGPLEDVCAPSALYMQECLCPQMSREPGSSAARQMLCDESTSTIFCAFFQGFGVQRCRSDGSSSTGEVYLESLSHPTYCLLLLLLLLMHRNIPSPSHRFLVFQVGTSLCHGSPNVHHQASPNWAGGGVACPSNLSTVTTFHTSMIDCETNQPLLLFWLNLSVFKV